jgi:hypothetical protein
MNGMLATLCDSVPDEDVPLQSKLRTEQEMLGYISYTDPSRPNTAVVMDLNTKYSTFKVQLYRVSTGDTVTAKVSKKTYEQMPITAGEVINYRTTKKPAWKKDGDNWVQDYSREELWLSSYTVE